VQTYRFASRYPPTSRPLGPYNDDLLIPNKRHEPFVTARHGQAHYQFSADRYFVVADERLEAYLAVQEDGAARITQAFIAVLEPNRAFDSLVRIPLEFSPARPGLYVSTIRAASLGLERVATLGVYIAFEIDGEPLEKASFTFLYTPDVAVPARFTGQFRESLVDGSLLIEAGIQVQLAGWYLIDCNLYDRDGYPVAWTRFKGQLPVGDAVVPLSFFGKVLRDAGAPSPYSIGQLRGQRHVEGRDPDSDSMPDYAGSFRTQSYSVASFSDREWDDPSRRARLERLAAP
jgi:hypothetical protein